MGFLLKENTWRRIQGPITERDARDAVAVGMRNAPDENAEAQIGKVRIRKVLPEEVRIIWDEEGVRKVLDTEIVVEKREEVF